MAAADGIALEAAASPSYGQYAHGVDCLWHGSAMYTPTRVETDGHISPVCPVCYGALRLVPEEQFWADVRQVNKSVTDAEAMLRWSAGMCFPDYGALEDAWRQASTE